MNIGLVIGFIGHSHSTRECTLQITITQRLVFSVTVFTALLGNVFQQWMFLCSQAHSLAGWRPSHTSNSRLRTISVLTRNGSWSSVYSSGTDRTENASSITACMSVAAITWWLLSHCLATGMFAKPFHNNGCLCWLHYLAFSRHATIRTYFRIPCSVLDFYRTWNLLVLTAMKIRVTFYL
jgi:hypothetical protein